MVLAGHLWGFWRALFHSLAWSWSSRPRATATLFLFLSLIVFGATAVQADTVSLDDLGPTNLSGSWFDPAKDGQGLVLQVLNPTTALVTWFTFDTEGDQAWMQGVGRIEGQRMVFDELLRFEGPKFGPSYNPADRQSIPSGQLSLTFSGCDAGVAEYEGVGDFPNERLTLSRLTNVAGFGCDQANAPNRFPLHQGLSGAWYAPAQDGQGWMVEVLNPTDALVYWFTYDNEGQQRWLLGVGSVKDEWIEVNDMQWAEGGRFGEAFNSNDVTRHSWGKLSLKLWPCVGAEAHYVAGRDPLSKRGEFSGVMPLAMLNGTEACPKHIDKWTAARFLDQAAFGPTPDEERRMHELGMEAWLAEQIALSPSTIEWQDLQCEGNFFRSDGRHRGPREGVDISFHGAAALRILDVFVGAPDQLRARMSWALSQLLVISSEGGIQEVGQAVYFNTLQEHALGNFRDLLRAVTISPSMGQYLDNAGSRAASERCPNCIPNENYSRELLMLFTLGVNQLNPDGSKKKNEKGEYLETFDQADVIALSRALSGWHFVDQIDTPDRVDYYEQAQACEAKGGGNGWMGGYEQSMRPIGYGAHDREEKRFLGHTMPANQTIQQDLEHVLDILMGHPNMAPFVAQRLIRHLTTSNPSPAYIQRVASVFADNGQGVVGDLAAVAKAIIMDPEARLGDKPDQMPRNFGRIRDLVHQKSAIYRGMECTETPSRNYWGQPDMNPQYGLRTLPQLPRNRPLGAPQVFNFYPPEHKVPGMDIIAPEHLLINFSGVQARVWALPGDRRELEVCDYAEFREKIMAGPDALIEHVKDRYLRGRESFAHEAFMHDYADGLRQWLINSEASSDEGARYEGYQMALFLGYALLGQEFGIVR